jgi:hypothetical protein
MTAQCRPTDIYQLILLAADDLQVTEQQRRTIHKLLLYGPEYTNNPNYYSNAAWRNIAAALNSLATATDTELSKAVSHALQLCLVAINRADTTASDVQIISAAMFHKLVQCIERQLSTQNLQACLRQARPIHKPCRSAAAVGTCTAAGPPSFRQINTALSMRQNERPQTTQ